MECGELAPAMFSLPYRFAVPDTLFEEELSERHSHLLKLGLIKKTLNGELVSKAYNLRQKYARVSVNDLLALTLAKDENCRLLTSDRALRDIANILEVDVNGTLWLVKKLITHEKITVEVATVAFQLMKESGSRLPWHKVDEMLKTS